MERYYDWTIRLEDKDDWEVCINEPVVVPEMLEEILSYAKGKGAEFVIISYNHFDEDGNEVIADNSIYYDKNKEIIQKYIEGGMSVIYDF